MFSSPRQVHNLSPRSLSGEKPRSGVWWYVKALFFLIALTLIGGVAFIKLNTAAAATLTDNVLRPLIGDQNVLWLEKIFFNTSDAIEKATYDKKQAVAVPVADQGPSQTMPGSHFDLSPLAVNADFPAIPGEGVWKNRPLHVFPDQEVMAYTFVRSDPARAYSITSIVQMDMEMLRLGLVAGRKEPGGPVGKPGPGKVPSDILASGNLVAAFDGGFQYKDGAYGMIVGSTTYLPLKNDLGTLIARKDGSLSIVDYQGEPLGSDVTFVRQNCPILIENGQVTVENLRSRALWGRLAKGTTDIFTWRSGVGLNKDGNLLFAVGNNLTPATLANALKAAGAVNAIQLDINPIWVRFNIFDSLGNGQYKSTSLDKQLYDGTKGYLDGYNKDFFYVSKK